MRHEIAKNEAKVCVHERTRRYFREVFVFSLIIFLARFYVCTYMTFLLEKLFFVFSVYEPLLVLRLAIVSGFGSMFANTQWIREKNKRRTIRAIVVV